MQVAAPPAPKLLIEHLAQARPDPQAGFRTPGGLAFDRVWVQVRVQQAGGWAGRATGCLPPPPSLAATTLRFVRPPAPQPAPLLLPC